MVPQWIKHSHHWEVLLVVMMSNALWRVERMKEVLRERGKELLVDRQNPREQQGLDESIEVRVCEEGMKHLV